MGGHRLPKRVMSESWRTRKNVGRGGGSNNGRTAWQRIFGCLASRGTGAPPHLGLGSGIAQYVKGAVGLCRVGEGRGKDVRTPAEEERSERCGQG